MNKAAVFIKNYSLGKSSPVLCMLDLLSDHFKVDLFLQNASYLKADVLEKENLNLIFLSDPPKSILRKIWHRLFPRNSVEANTDTAIKQGSYDVYLCFDSQGFFLCKTVFPNSSPFYYSLELCFKDDHFNLDYPDEIMNREKAEINRIKGLIIQSKEREQLFRAEHVVSPEIPAFILPVTYLQPSVEKKSSLLRNKYKISEKKRIALHLGGIQEYFSCIELALTFSKIDDWVLIFHGYYFGEYIDKLRNVLAKNNITNVIISDEVYDRIEDMDPLLMSCDLGLAWYNDVSLNFSTAGKSSGKISAYLRFGLPVIAKKYPSTQEALEQTGCGVCVGDFAGIPDAVQKISGNYEYYSENCRREYDAVYWFENYREKLMEFMSR